MAHKFELLIAFVRRDFQVRYSQSIVGLGWAIAQPLCLMFVFSLVFGKFVKVDTEGIPYPIFVYSCLVPWSFFGSALGRGTASIVVESNIIKKVAVSRILFPVAAVLASFVDFLIAGLIMVVMMIYYDVAWSPWMLMVFPLTTLLMFLTIGLSLFLCSINAYFRDIHFGLPLATQILFYASPIVYAVNVVPDNLRWAYNLNPMAGMMVGFRNVLIKGIAPDWELLGIATVVTLIVCLIGYGVFRRLEGNFADII